MSAVLEAREPEARHLGALEPKLVRQFDLLVGASAGVTRLREFILALAMQGKLLSQDPTDEPADKLVRRLMAERGESTLRRRTAASTGGRQAGEASDVLPSSWKAASLSAISVKLTDGSHNPPRDAGSGIPMLSSQNVLESGTIDFGSPTRYVSVDDFERENVRTNATPGDVLLTIVASLGRSAVVPVDAPAFVLQRSVAVIRTGLVPSFLAMFLRSPAARAYYDEHGKGTAQKGIYLGKLGELTVPIPPLAEQTRIVARVDELMRLCDALEAKGRLQAEQHARLLGTLLGTLTDSSTPEELAANWQRVADHFDLLLDRPEAVDALEQTILQLAVRGLLVPQDSSDEPASVLLAKVQVEKQALVAAGRIRREAPSTQIESDEQPYELPAGWQWVRLRDIWLSSFYGPRFGSEEYVQVGGVPTIRTTDMTDGEIVLKDPPRVQVPADKLDVFRIEPGDLLVTRSGSIGVMALFHLNMVAVPSAYLIRIRFSKNVDANYCLRFFLGDLGQSQLGLGTTSVGVPNVSASKMADFLFPLPPRSEQTRIVARIDELRRLCSHLRQSLAASQTTQSHLAAALVDEVA